MANDPPYGSSRTNSVAEALSGSPDQASAYAALEWARFDDEVSDTLMRAVTSTFALVAASDGDLAETEAQRFMKLMRTRAALFPPLDFDLVEDAYRDACSALLSDPVSGRSRALAYVAKVKHTASHCQLILAAAHLAIEADDRRGTQEQAVLADIKRTLELTDD